MGILNKLVVVVVAGVGYVMYPVLLIMSTAFQSFILRDNNQ